MDVAVSEEGQRRICRFSALNHACVELDSRIEKLKTDLRVLHDAQEEATIALDPSDVLLRVGECYVEMESETVETALKGKVEETETLLQQCEQQLEEKKMEMLSLKKQLYGEFGDRINLDK